MTYDGKPPAGPGEEESAAGGDEEEGDAEDEMRFGHGTKGVGAREERTGRVCSERKLRWLSFYRVERGVLD